MAITEPRAAGQPASGPPSAGGPARTRPRHGRRRWALAGVAALLVVALVLLVVLAGAYQPVQLGGEGGGSFPGLPTAAGLQSVNTFGLQQGQLYVPPQLAAFTVVESIQNTGPVTVTITAVSILSPQAQQAQHYPWIGTPAAAWPLLPAGPAQAMIDTYPPSGIPRPAAGLSLGPGQEARIAIPVRLGAPCYERQGWTTADTFYVEERFLTFSHWVAISFPLPYLFHQPADRGQEPAKDLTCLTK